MKTSQFLCISAFIYIAPHMPEPNAVFLAVVFGVAALVMRYVGKD